MLSLSDYGMSRERGFLASFDPERVELPPALKPARALALSIPQLVCTGRVRALLERLPVIDLTEFCTTASEAEQRIAMLHYSFMVQTYVWGEPEAPRALPACLAVPIWQLSKSLGQPPLLPYSSYTLENWALIDQDGPIDLSNVRVIQHFDGGMDEAWFILVHVAIEARAGEMLEEALSLMAAAEAGDIGEAGRCLSVMSSVWDDVNAIFDRMPERCDPYCYFHRVRPWIRGPGGGRHVRL